MRRYPPRTNSYFKKRGLKVKPDRSPISDEKGRKIINALKGVSKKKSEEEEK